MTTEMTGDFDTVLFGRRQGALAINIIVINIALNNWTVVREKI